MSTDKTISINGTQLAPRVISNTVLTNGVYRSLHSIDMGSVARNNWEDERPTLDGMRRRGSVWKSRNMVWQIMSSVNEAAVSAGNIERVRDDEMDALSALLISENLLTCKVARAGYPSDAVARVIYAEVSDLGSWKWQKTALDDGYVGRHDGPILMLSVPLHCPFPWWADETATSTAALTLDGTLRTTNITNLSPNPVGVKISMVGAGVGKTIEISNTTTGLSSTVSGVGIVLTDVDMDATNALVVDQYVTDPQVFNCYRSVSLASEMAALASRPRLWLAPGVNEISWQTTAGSSSGDTITFSHRGWWGNP